MSFLGNLSLMCARAALGNLGGVVSVWQYIPSERHSEGLECLLLLFLFCGAPRALEALMSVHGTHPEVEIMGDGRCTYIPSSDNGKKSFFFLEKSTKIYKTSYGFSLVNPDAIKILQKYGNEHPECIQGSDDYMTPFTTIYTDVAHKLAHRLSKLHPHVKDTILKFGYGNLLHRNFMNVHDLEIIAVATNSALGTKMQLYSHMRGALSNGATGEELREVIELLYGMGDLSEKKYILAKETLCAVEKSNMAKQISSKI